MGKNNEKTFYTEIQEIGSISFMYLGFMRV